MLLNCEFFAFLTECFILHLHNVGGLAKKCKENWRVDLKFPSCALLAFSFHLIRLLNDFYSILLGKKALSLIYVQLPKFTSYSHRFPIVAWILVAGEIKGECKINFGQLLHLVLQGKIHQKRPNCHTACSAKRTPQKSL